MKCEEIEGLIAASLAGGLAAQERTALQGHLEGCSACAAELREMERTWSALDAWGDEEPPILLTEAVKGQILRDLSAESEARVFTPGRLLMGAALGVALSAMAMLFLPGRPALSAISPTLLLSCGTFWAGVFAFASLLTLRNPARGVVNWRGVGLAGLLAMGGFMVLTRSCSMLTIIDACRRSAWGNAMLDAVGVEGSYLLLGALYAAIPLVVVSLFLREREPSLLPLAHGLASGVLLFALLLPAILLQCEPFTAGAVTSWIVGSLAGSLIGGPVGSWAASRLAGAYA